VHVDGAFGQPGLLALERLGVHDGPFYEWRGRSMAAHDGAVHARLRATVVRAFTPLRVERLRASLTDHARTLLVSARRQQSFDVVADYARDLPLWLICEFLGLPVDAREEIATFLEGTESGFTDPLTPQVRQVAEDGIVALGQFVGGLVTNREALPQEDLVSDLLDAERAGRLDRNELVALVVNVLGGAIGSSRAAITNSLLLLLSHPEQAAWVAAAPEQRLTPAIEECLRFHPPFRSGRKLVLADNDALGAPLRTGDTVFLARQAANRDPDRWTDPNRFDVTRVPERHYSFGVTVHTSAWDRRWPVSTCARACACSWRSYPARACSRRPRSAFPSHPTNNSRSSVSRRSHDQTKADAQDVLRNAEVNTVSRRSTKTALVLGLTASGAVLLLARTGLGTRVVRFALPRISDRAWTLPVLPTLMARRWEGRYAELAALEMQPGDIVMLGDSITEGGDWATLFPEIRVHNHGIGGDDTVGVLRRLDLVTRARPEKVFVMIGTNDLGKGTRTVDAIIANVAEIVTRIRDEVPSTTIFVQSVLPRWHTRTDDVRRLNDGIEAIAKSTGAAWIDLRLIFDRGDGAMDLELAPDALHPNAEGYRRWAELIAPMMETADNR